VQWHLQDPVDDDERARNDAVFGFQGNRNPFVDHPEWVPILFAGGAVGPVLVRDVAAIDLAAGGTQNFSLFAGAAEAGSPYLLLGTMTGASPGIQLNGVSIPLNVDAYTCYTYYNANVWITGSSGTLDGAGNASAALPFAPGSPMSLAGLQLHHAFAVFNAGGRVSAASNAVSLDLVFTSGAPTLVVKRVPPATPVTIWSAKRAFAPRSHSRPKVVRGSMVAPSPSRMAVS